MKSNSCDVMTFIDVTKTKERDCSAHLDFPDSKPSIIYYVTTLNFLINNTPCPGQSKARQLKSAAQLRNHCSAVVVLMGKKYYVTRALHLT